MVRTFKFRIYPSKHQTETLGSQLAICCELYNAALQERRDAWTINRKRIGYFDQAYQLTHIKPERPDVAGVHSTALEHTLKRVDEAFKGFFRRLKRGQKAGYPRFRSVRRFDSLMFRQLRNILTGNKLRLPKIGQIKIRISRPVLGKIKTVTVKREAGRWFALFTCECSPVPLPFNPAMIGVDVGLKTFATFSDGTTIENPRWYQNAQAALRIAQRKVARRQKGSVRRQKAALTLRRTYVYIRNQRADFQHKLSRRLVNRHGLIAVEDLNVKGLAGGMLAKSVNDAGWSSFIYKLAYKAEEAGRVFFKVDPRGTSQTCPCGAMVRKTLSMREHVCTECGLVADRDHVSAQVILQRAVRCQASTWPTVASVA